MTELPSLDDLVFLPRRVIFNPNNISGCRYKLRASSDRAHTPSVKCEKKNAREEI
jgi:hypothetical protein